MAFLFVLDAKAKTKPKNKFCTFYNKKFKKKETNFNLSLFSSLKI